MNARGPPPARGGRFPSRPPSGRFFGRGRDGRFEGGRGFFRGGRGRYDEGRGRFDGRFDGRGRSDEGRGGRVMSSYSSLGRGSGGSRFDDAPSGGQRVAMGSYSSLAGPVASGPPVNSNVPRSSYAEMGKDNDDATVNSPPQRGSYSALADSVMDPPRSSYAMMANEPSQPPPQLSPPPPQAHGIKRQFHDGPPPQGYNEPPRDYMDRGPSREFMERNDGYNNNTMERRIDGYIDRNDDFGPPRPSPNDWDRDAGINNRSEFSVQEDQFGRARPPPMRGGFRGSFGGRSSGRGPPMNRFRDQFDDDRQQQPMEEEQPLPRRDSGRLDEAENNYSRQPSLSSYSDRINDQQPPQKSYQRQPIQESPSPQQPIQPPVDIVPTSPPRTPSPQPSQPSAFTIAMMRMVEMNADMEFAHAKLKMLEMEHKRVMARLDALKEVNRVEQDGS